MRDTVGEAIRTGKVIKHTRDTQGLEASETRDRGEVNKTKNKTK